VVRDDQPKRLLAFMARRKGDVVQRIANQLRVRRRAVCRFDAGGPAGGHHLIFVKTTPCKVHSKASSLLSVPIK
jgi:hypothetical protein